MKTTFLVAAAVLACVGLAVARWQPAALALLNTCPFQALTGLSCPTCGTTHAAVALSHGRLAAALAANPLAAATLLLLLPATLASIALRRVETPQRTRRILAWSVAVLVLLNWGYLLAR